jgi:hypothetical protein
VSQQTPSTQLPEAHCDAAKQVLPLVSFAMHSPPPQNAPETHSASLVQLVAHAVPAHT